MIIIDLSFIRFNLYAGVSKYAYRLLDYIVEEGKSDDYILLFEYRFGKQDSRMVSSV